MWTLLNIVYFITTWLCIYFEMFWNVMHLVLSMLSESLLELIQRESFVSLVKKRQKLCFIHWTQQEPCIMSFNAFTTLSISSCISGMFSWTLLTKITLGSKQNIILIKKAAETVIYHSFKHFVVCKQTGISSYVKRYHFGNFSVIEEYTRWYHIIKDFRHDLSIEFVIGWVDIIKSSSWIWFAILYEVNYFCTSGFFRNKTIWQLILHVIIIAICSFYFIC